MKNSQRFLAIIGIIILVLCAILTLVFALLTEFGVGDFSTAWKASAWAMVIIPALMYAMLLLHRVLNGKGVK